MRLTIALVVGFVLAACALQQSGAERAFVGGDNVRATQAALDAEAIMQGMAQARSSSQRMARDTRGTSVAVPAVTR